MTVNKHSGFTVSLYRPHEWVMVVRDSWDRPRRGAGGFFV